VEADPHDASGGAPHANMNLLQGEEQEILRGGSASNATDHNFPDRTANCCNCTTEGAGLLEANVDKEEFTCTAATWHFSGKQKAPGRLSGEVPL